MSEKVENNDLKVFAKTAEEPIIMRPHSPHCHYGANDEPGFIVAPPGWQIKSLDDVLAYPRRIKQHARFDSFDSFCDYVRRFRTRSTTCFYTSNNPRPDNKGQTEIIRFRMLAYLDYHGGPGNEGDWASDYPSHCSHSAEFIALYSDELKAWNAIHTQWLEHEDFIDFLVENLHTIADKDDQALIMRAAPNFRATTQRDFTSIRQLEDGGVQAIYQETVRQQEVEGTALLPSSLAVELSIFDDFYWPQTIEIHVRWRIKDKKAYFQMRIHRPQYHMRQASDALCDEIKKQLDDLDPPIAFYKGAV